MTSLRESLRRMFSPVQPLPAGMFHYQAPPNDPRNYRMHLRLEPDGTGVLIINAATVLHLNSTAAEYAYYMVQNLPADQVARKMAARYHTTAEQAAEDYRDLTGRIQTLITTPDLAPDTFLDFDRQKPFSGRIAAPYRLDCALTYSLPAGALTSDAPTDRVKRELTTQEWKQVLDKAWAAGIPHVIFTGGEPTLRADLPELIEHTEQLGQVCGLLSDGLRLAEPAYLERLLQTGLDHLMLILQVENETSWKALADVLAADLFVAVHLTLTPENQAEIPALLERLANLGLPALSLSASDAALQPALQAARERAAALHMELIWNLPVPYMALHPVRLELAETERPEGAGRAWLYVEPDGDVLPGQGGQPVLGNFLTDNWEQIWRRA